VRILLVEDDVRIRTPIKQDLEQQQYVVDEAADGQVAWELCAEEHYDLVLLDVMLPKLDGIALCQKLRSNGFTGAILMLTARGEKFDKISGLDSGADDYVVKPFDLDELGARVRALLRRNAKKAAPKLEWDKLSVDMRSCEVIYDGNLVKTTPTEYRLLITFLRHPGRIFSRRDLIERLWHFEVAPAESVIKAHIKGLRKNLALAGCTREVVETVFGFGYRLSQSEKA
jgi:DNA-binding response OmpR family regulator